MQNEQLFRAQWKERVCASLIIDELDLIHLGRQHFDNRANLSSAKLPLRYIFGQRHNIQQLNLLPHTLPHTT